MQSRARAQFRLARRRVRFAAPAERRLPWIVLTHASFGAVFPEEKPEEHMANDPYETRPGWRETRTSRPRDDDRFERGSFDRDREDRGFFERAGDEIASWFGDEEAERRRAYDDPERGRRFERGRSDFGSRQRFSGEPGRFGRSDHDRGYRPLTGDYGRSDYEPSRRSEYGGREFEGRREFGGRGEFAGRYGFGGAHHGDTFDRGTSQRFASRGGFDPQYGEWRQRQIDSLDRDYDEYRRENQSRFERDFAGWRDQRQAKRRLLGEVREQMEVLGSDNEHVGTVDRVAGDRLILTKSDPEAGGVHHSLMCTDIDRIEDDRVILDMSAEQAKTRWRDESRDRALFEREDRGEAGPHILDRSFSGTYR
jgi:hypothetical protein